MCDKHLEFGDEAQITAKKLTKREKFLADMNQVVPLQALINLIESDYPKTSSSNGGCTHYPLVMMVQIHSDAAVVLVA